MHYNQDVFKITALIIGHRKGKIPLGRFRHFLPGVIDYLNSSHSSTGMVIVTYDNQELIELASPKIAEPALSKISLTLETINTNDLRYNALAFAKILSAKPSSVDAYSVKRGGGYTEGPILAYAFRPGFLATPNFSMTATA